MSWRTAQLSVGQSGRGQDRALVLAYTDRVVLAVADGAGGSTQGAHAAETIIERVQACCEGGAFVPEEILRDCDQRLAREAASAESTAVLITVDARGIVGASVGDSAAWLVTSIDHVDLTGQQVRKPLIGSGRAVPVSFASGPLDGTLVLGTDGLFKYGPASRIRQIATEIVLEAIPQRLIDSVRLQSGALHDDTTVVICRAR